MKNCLVCDSNITFEASCCHQCRWPTGAIVAMASNPSLQEEVLHWAREKYQETRFGASTITLPPSKMNVQIGNAESVETLNSDFLLLNRVINKQVESDETTTKLFDKLEKQEQSILKIEEAISSSIFPFLEEHNNISQELNRQIQSNKELLGNHEQELQKLSFEQQQYIKEIDMLKCILTRRSQNSPVIATSTNSEEQSLQVIMNTTELNFAPEELDLLRDYNGYPQEVPNFLREQSTNVSIDDETFTRLRDGNESNITFKFERKGNYLVISRGGYRYLLPNKQRKIITQIYTVTKAIYNCDGYSESYKDFRLIKPALVQEESVDCWKLSRKGILEFI